MNEQASAFLRLVTRSLGGHFPIRLAVGVSIATFLKMLTSMASRNWPDILAFRALDDFSVLACTRFG